MSHDILRRLRLDVDGQSIHPGYYRQDMIDAAEEIERLRGQLEELGSFKGELTQVRTMLYHLGELLKRDHERHQAEIAELRAENARMRLTRP